MLILAASLFAVQLLSVAYPHGGAVSAAPPERLGVEGFLVVKGATLGKDVRLGRSHTLFVPGVTVRLRRGTIPIGKPVRTDLSGRFVFPPQRAGRYRACWQARGFVSGCTKPFPLALKYAYLGLLRINPQQLVHSATFFGTVRMADGSVPRTYQPLENVNAFAIVRADVRARASARPHAYVNNFGEYILPGVPATKPIRLRAVIEAAASTAVVAAPAPALKRIDFTLKNRRPHITGVTASAPGGKHWTAAPGDTITLTARASDPDGDPLRYRWTLPDSSSVLPAAGTPTATATLPNLPGAYEFEVVAFDRNGGYATDRIRIDTNGVRFAGKVNATNATAVAGAHVEINGHTATTAADGTFALHVPESTRYVLNIRKQGYALLSKIYDNGISDGAWTLTRASVVTVDPTQTIDVANTRIPTDCPGSFAEQLRRKGKPGDCGPGIRVHIPADSLVDGAGNRPAGPVNIALTTVDLASRDGMPGDFTLIDSSGDERWMESYGAGAIDVTAGGTPYNLAPGAQAEVTIPIDRAQLAAPTTPPTTIPLLFYDEKNGVWREEGKATRSGNTYVASVSHFSSINVDLEKSTPSCVRFDATVMPTTFDLQFTVPLSSGGSSTYTLHVNNDIQRFHVIYRLPNAVAMTVETFDTTTSPPTQISLNSGGAEVTSLTVNTGAPQSPQTPIFPSFPYAACQTSVELVPFRLPPDVQDEFLAGLYSFSAQNLTELDVSNPANAGTVRTAAQAYYDTVDPQHRRLDLADFKTANGFGTGTGTEAQAYYANSGDLGFGRDMHCHKNALDVACYVTNYGNRFTDDVQDYKDAVDDNTPIATVGMEYSRVENPTGTGFQQTSSGGDLRIVKFYVFGHAVPSTDPAHSGQGDGRVVSADLDGFGQRPVPALCMVCHGGRYPSSTSVGSAGQPIWNTSNANSADLGSNFIPFDLRNFTIVNYLQASSGNVISESGQQPNFKHLNEDYVWNATPSAATKEVIDGLYGAAAGTNPPLPSANQVPPFTVSGWTGTSISPNQEETYKEVVGPSCRSCHISQPSYLWWNTAAQFKGFAIIIEPRVCQQHVMPHAKVTHNRFWLSLGPHQPPILAAFLANTGGTPLATNPCNQ
jgi:K319L-like, PKD domain